MSRRCFRLLLPALAMALALGPSGQAQLSPHFRYQTIRTQHFDVHFPPGLEEMARRSAAEAEFAYAALARELVAPRGRIDLVVSDDADFANGWATPYPSNRVVIYATPPIGESTLRFTNDHLRLVIVHELAHIFHLDRARGIWALGQRVFGRAAPLFPNFSSPAWLYEGLAVYYETRIAGAGRLEGTEHRMMARAAAIEHRFPVPSQASLAAPRFPFGHAAYAYGSLFVDHLTTVYGHDRLRAFVESASGQLLPFLIDVPARRAFGVSFAHAWRRWADSMVYSLVVPDDPPLPGWRDLTREGAHAYAPRWLGDTAIVYTGTPGREAFGAYQVDLEGRRTRIGRRNSRSANVPFDGGLLYAQLDFVNPYQARMDLYVQRGRQEERLTDGARLTTPDARADGRIVATQIIPGGTRLVLVSPDGGTITPLTGGGFDEQWNEPRWSNAGDRIVATRWLRGAISQVVVLDTTGRIERLVSSSRSIEATPSWLPGDAGVVYSSDRTGEAQVYVARFYGAETWTFVASRAVTGLFDPQVAPTMPLTAAVLLRADGYHIGVGECCAPGAEGLSSVPTRLDTVPTFPPPLRDATPATAFSPWRSALPRYWLPIVEPGIRQEYRIGGFSSGSDVVGRHAWYASLAVPTENTGVVGGATYSYAGFGQPTVHLSAVQDWAYLFDVVTRDEPPESLGRVRRRSRDGAADVTWTRQRVRSALAFSLGAGAQVRDYASDPPGLFDLIDTTGRYQRFTIPRLTATFGYINVQRPPYSISPEDGFQFGLTVRERLRSGIRGEGPPSLSAVATLAGYKSLDLRGFAHHVIALRTAAGAADLRTSNYFEIGGVSGTPFEIFPGYTVGEGRRTFPVRGFPAGTYVGTRAVGANLEYRFPLFLVGRGLATLPFFMERSSIALFADYANANCHGTDARQLVCTQPEIERRRHIGSYGGELNVNLGLLTWDSPYRFRVGAAVPVLNRNFFGAPLYSVYATAGVSF